MIHWLSTAVRVYLLHPLKGNGYQWWSGAGANFGEITVIGMVLGAIRHVNCHHKGCWKPGHRHPEHGWPACKRHWNETPDHAQSRD